MDKLTKRIQGHIFLYQVYQVPLRECMLNCSASFVIQHAIPKSCLENLISKDTHLSHCTVIIITLVNVYVDLLVFTCIAGTS